MDVPFDPLLPADWPDKALAFGAQGSDGYWIRAMQGVIQRHAERALVIDEVQRLVMMSCGLDRRENLVPQAALESIPDRDWAIATAWGERSSKKGYSPGTIFNAATDIRSVHDELNALRMLSENGYEVIRDRSRGYDWKLRQGSKDLHVEVKSKGDAEIPYDLLYSTHVASILLDSGRRTRRLHFNPDIPDNRRILTSRFSPKYLDDIFGGLIAALPRIAEWLSTVREPWADQLEVFEGRCSLTITGSRTCAALEVVDQEGCEPGVSIGLEYDPEYPGEYRYHMGRTKAAFEPQQLSLSDLEETLRSLKRSAFKDGRQAAAAPPGTLFLLAWHSPFSWDAALRESEDVVTQGVRDLSDALREFRSDACIGLWSLGFVGGAAKVYLSDDAKELLRLDHLEIPMSREP